MERRRLGSTAERTTTQEYGSPAAAPPYSTTYYVTTDIHSSNNNHLGRHELSANGVHTESFGQEQEQQRRHKSTHILDLLLPIPVGRWAPLITTGIDTPE